MSDNLGIRHRAELHVFFNGQSKDDPFLEHFTNPHDFAKMVKKRQEAEMEHCRRHVVHFVNSWVFTFDPRLQAGFRDIPFDLFARQADFLLWLEERRALGERTQMKAGGVCPKSRERGVTWLCCAYATHQWLFSSSSSIGFGSLKLEEVDEIGNMNTILEKIRYILRHLPQWMLPKGYKEEKHATHAKIINPANGSIIVGEGGENLGRGGKCGMFFFDEASHSKNAESINSALSANTHVRIDVSTFRGSGNDFFKKCYGGDYVEFDPADPEVHTFSKFSLHWRDDPRTSEAWAAAIKTEIGPVNWAEQYDMDPFASMENIVIPAIWVKAAVELELPEGDGPIIGGLDCSGEGANDTVFIPRRGPRAQKVVFWNGLDTTQSAHKAADVAEKNNVKELNYDVSGLGIGYKSAWKATDRVLPFRINPINTGLPPTEAKWSREMGRTSKELFVNQKAEFWWMLRTRFEKTYEHVEGLAEHPTDELISIPNDPQLIAELSSPTYEVRETGKKVIEAKKTMRKRGIKSPDRADALVLAFCPPPKRKRAVFW